jgi:hypothetical protein
MRGDMASMKEEMRALRERMSTLEAQLTGLTYLITTGLGSILHDIGDLKARVEALEGAR